MAEPTERTAVMDAPTPPGPAGLWDEIVDLLRRSELPVEDLERDDLGSFVLVRGEGRLLGIGALEAYGHHALIRSVAVDPSQRGNGLGGRIVDHLEDRARTEGISRLYLLTTTAEEFFRRAGYASMSREEAPVSIRGSAQFSQLCPDSAAFMGKDLSREVRG